MKKQVSPRSDKELLLAGLGFIIMLMVVAIFYW